MATVLLIPLAIPRRERDTLVGWEPIVLEDAPGRDGEGRGRTIWSGPLLRPSAEAATGDAEEAVARIAYERRHQLELALEVRS
jgi:hypothetical protein